MLRALILDLLGLTLGLLERSWGAPGVPGALPGASGEPLGASKIAPGGSPGGLPRRRSILGSFWGPFWLHFWTPKSLKISVFVWKGCIFRENREVRKKTPKRRNLAIMEREAREAGGRASIASKARAERAARTARAGATRQRTAARREWREPPEDRDSKPVRSLMPLRGRYAAPPGGLSWERLGRIALL